jgi:hypothetical protein
VGGVSAYHQNSTGLIFLDELWTGCWQIGEFPEIAIPGIPSKTQDPEMSPLIFQQEWTITIKQSCAAAGPGKESGLSADPRNPFLHIACSLQRAWPLLGSLSEPSKARVGAEATLVGNR